MNKQLKMGIKDESEHKRTYLFIQSYIRKYKRMPSQKEVYEKIASDHLRQKKNYYTLLNKARL
jgi:hypothetical protein